MKKFWSIGFGLLAIIALSYFAFFWKKGERAGEEKPSFIPGSPLIDISQVKQFELINNKGKVKFSRDKDDNFWITEPEKDVPDPLFFGGMIDVLSQLLRERAVVNVEGQNLSQYGLDPAFATLIFELSTNEKKVLRIGNPNPTMSALFAYYEDEPYIFLTQPKIRMFLRMGFNELRFRRLVNIKPREAKEVKIVVSDPELRKKLSVPQLRYLTRQNTPMGETWILLSSPGKRTDTSQIENLLNWMQNSSIAEKVLTIKQSELSQWGLNPPRAYFEIVFPDRTEKVLVSREKDDFIYLYQSQRNVVLGYKKEYIFGILSADFQVHKLIFEDEPPKFSKIEMSFSDGENINLVKLDNHYWALDGDAEKRFRMEKIGWVISPFSSWIYDDFIKGDVDFKKYGFQKPRAKIKFYSGDTLMKEFWVGDWDFKQNKCYVYLPMENTAVFYSRDILTQIPKNSSVFFTEKNEQEVDK